MRIRNRQRQSNGWVARLRKVDPREWRNRIMELPVKLQVFVAQIVWWDFFADKTVPNRWSDLDLWLCAHRHRLRRKDGPSPDERKSKYKMEEIQLKQYQEAHNKQAEIITQLRNQLRQYKHFCLQAAEVIEALKHRVLRTNDNANAFPNDRTVLLDADLVLSECYRMNLK